MEAGAQDKENEGQDAINIEVFAQTSLPAAWPATYMHNTAPDSSRRSS
jgi:hypothetical protein